MPKSTLMTRLATIGTLAIAALAAGPAAAAEYGPNETQCRGKLLDTQDIIVEGTIIAQVQLYYAANENGLYCARNVHKGPTTGRSLDTGITMRKASTRNGAYSQAGYQRGDYSQVAGPIGSRGTCIVAGGGIDWRGARRFGWTRTFCTDGS